jgi:hypothetical protein
MYEVRNVSRSGFYAWLKRDRPDREKEGAELVGMGRRVRRLTRAGWLDLRVSSPVPSLTRSTTRPTATAWWTWSGAGSCRPGRTIVVHRHYLNLKSTFGCGAAGHIWPRLLTTIARSSIGRWTVVCLRAWTPTSEMSSFIPMSVTPVFAMINRPHRSIENAAPSEMEHNSLEAIDSKITAMTCFGCL